METIEVEFLMEKTDKQIFLRVQSHLLAQHNTVPR